jgi:hypothetical protein
VSRNSVRAWVLPSVVAHRIGSVPLVAAWAWRTLGLLALVCYCCLVELWQFDVYIYFFTPKYLYIYLKLPESQGMPVHTRHNLWIRHCLGQISDGSKSLARLYHEASAMFVPKHFQKMAC